MQRFNLNLKDGGMRSTPPFYMIQQLKTHWNMGKPDFGTEDLMGEWSPFLPDYHQYDHKKLFFQEV